MKCDDGVVSAEVVVIERAEGYQPRVQEYVPHLDEISFFFIVTKTNLYLRTLPFEKYTYKKNVMNQNPSQRRRYPFPFILISRKKSRL